MMRCQYGWRLGVFLGVILTSCFVFPGAWSGDVLAQETELQPVGKIERTQGATMVMRAGQTDFVPIGTGEPVFVQDTIGTAPGDPNAKMWWRNPSPVLMDASLGRDSLLGFESFTREGPASSFLGSVSRGMVRFIRKVPATQPESSFRSMSPTALVEVIPGDQAADYVVSVLDDDHTSVTVIWGSVVVRNISESTTQQRIVTSCQTVMVEKDKEPSEVMPVGSDALRELIKLTTIPGTLPTNVPSCTPPAQPVPPDVYIPPEPPEVIVIPGEPGVIGPGFVPVPIPPYDGYTGDPGDTIDTTDTDTTPTDTTPTDTTPTDTTPTLTFTLTFIDSVTFTLDLTDTFTITFDPPTFTFTLFPTLIDTSVIDTGVIGTFTFSPTLIDTSVLDTGTGVLPTFTFSPTLIDTSVIDTGVIGSFTFSPTLIDTSVIDTGTGGGIGTFTFSPTFVDTGVIDTGAGGVSTVPTFTGVVTFDTGSGVSTVSTGGGATFSTGFGTGEPFIQTFSTGSAPVTHDKQLQQLNQQQQQLQQQQRHEFQRRPGH
jgi:hypothetical protein